MKSVLEMTNKEKAILAFVSDKAISIARLLNSIDRYESDTTPAEGEAIRRTWREHADTLGLADDFDFSLDMERR